MSGQEATSAQKFREYVETVRGTVSDNERLLYFMDLVRSLLGVHLVDFEVEKQVYQGRANAPPVNLVFEFKLDIHWQLEDAELQLKRHITDLKSRNPETTYTAIATDGLHFHVYIPHYDETGRVVKLENAAGLNLASPMMTSEQAVHDLKILLAHLRRE